MNDNKILAINTIAHGRLELWVRSCENVKGQTFPVIVSDGKLHFAESAKVKGVFSKRVEITTSDQSETRKMFKVSFDEIADRSQSARLVQFLNEVALVEAKPKYFLVRDFAFEPFSQE